MSKIVFDRVKLIETLKNIHNINPSCKLDIMGNTIECINNTVDQQIILHVKDSDSIISNESEDLIEWNCLSIDQLLAALNCIEEEEVVLKHLDNKVSHKSSAFNFCYYLCEPEIIPKVPISKTKIDEFQYDVEFTIDKKVHSKILKGKLYATNTEKLYICIHPSGEVYLDLKDNQRQNINTITFLCDTIETRNLEKMEYPLDFASFMKIPVQPQTKVFLNEKFKIFKFEQNHNKYIVSTLTH